MTRQRAEASDDERPGGQDGTAAIRLHLDELLGRRGMTLTELSARVGITIANLSILKNGKARAIRFSTLARLCEALGCQPGELLSYQRQRDRTSRNTASLSTMRQPAMPIGNKEEDP